MKFQLGSKWSDILLTIYVLATLYLRINYEWNGNVSIALSLVLGLSFLAIPYVLVKLKVLNPSLFNSSTSKTPRHEVR